MRVGTAADNLQLQRWGSAKCSRSEEEMSVPTIDEQRAFYDKRWTQKQFANRLQLERAIEILRGLSALKLDAPRILDLGCGTGWLTAILGRFGAATGVDLSPAAIRTARERHPDVEFRDGDISMSSGHGEFDVVVSQEVIEHLEDQRAHLELAARCLRPGGYLILTTPNAWNFDRWSEERREAWGPQPIEKWLRASELRRIVEERFSVLELRSIVLGGGRTGMLRIVNSPRLARILKKLRLLNAYQELVKQGGFGKHLFVVAKRRV
jgi:2-polyprenyl-3-methyl-5-hydroxy-6-metoxy-1,4-benzoquinol methylase